MQNFNDLVQRERFQDRRWIKRAIKKNVRFSTEKDHISKTVSDTANVIINH